MQVPKLICFDVGARNGLRDLQFISEQIHLYSFEPNITNSDTLNKNVNAQYASFELIKKGLYNKSGVFDFYIMANPSMSSLLMPDENILDEYFNSIKEFKDWRKQLTICDTKKIETTTIDELVKEKNINCIDYLKLDTQGTELAILKGAQATLQSQKIIIIKTEFAFIPLYKDQPVFGDIDLFLKANGYKLITCDFKYDAHLPSGKQYEMPKWGISGDAYYCIDFEKTPAGANDKKLKAALVIGGLGFLSNADYLFNQLKISKEEQLEFYKKNKSANKKAILKYFISPALIHFLKKIALKRPK